MYALVVDNFVLIFDLVKYYGFHKLDECNFEGFFKVIYLKEIIDYFGSDVDVFKIEPYLDFLYRLCVKYVKDCF